MSEFDPTIQPTFPLPSFDEVYIEEELIFGPPTPPHLEPLFVEGYPYLAGEIERTNAHDLAQDLPSGDVMRILSALPHVRASSSPRRTGIDYI